ncbi:MAG: 16S rRNA (guanine(527)-N(7))-methyltransferase RsmG [Porticoccaceae bacterium]|nr:16S rRNA (guanine(527)-N(7))-methyltransferase RsmG [Porticoccaceae bacterium]
MQLIDGLSELDQTYPEHQIEQLISYLLLLHRWSRAYNLTAIKEPEAMLVRHLLDSIAVTKYLRGLRFLDVGTGAGLPGIPLAIANQDRNFDLLDSNGKKIRFLFQVRTQLGLSNVQERQQRVENLVNIEKYDGILSRAFASLSDMVKSTQHLLASDGRFYALKGKISEIELKALPDDYGVELLTELIIPGLNEQRHLIVIEQR